ncbi:hypothetical protein MHU86_10064 [Fragilaria crotonensis]|nr:hypothetical protein MHU86_10064 [Fragilaria crotonensis]
MATLTNGSPALLGTNKLGPGMRSTRAEAEAARNRRRKDTRNTARLALADETDKLTTAVKGPDDNKTEIPSWFIVELARAASRKTEVPAKSPIQFEQNAKAAEANAKILKESNFNVSELIEKFSDTTLGYGSEFRTVNQLKPIIGRHPNFDKLALVLTRGMPYVFKTELTSTTKSAELRTLLKRGKPQIGDGISRPTPETSGKGRDTRLHDSHTGIDTGTNTRSRSATARGGEAVDD